MDPIPLPENLQKLNAPMFSEKKSEKPEKNFIVLTELKAKDGIIESFVPNLRDKLAEDINSMLNQSDFSNSPIDFAKIIPNYGKDLAVYCVCGEPAEIVNVQVCNWKDELKYYLFESVRCNCGEKLYVLSLMDDSNDLPEELKKIFAN
jgi:hypothetical protein